MHLEGWDRPLYPVPFDPLWWYLTRVDLTALRIIIARSWLDGPCPLAFVWVGWHRTRLCPWLWQRDPRVWVSHLVLWMSSFGLRIPILARPPGSAWEGPRPRHGWYLFFSFSFRRRDGRGIGGCLRSHPGSKGVNRTKKTVVR